ncbi:hypothetical protein ACFQMM_01140 [Saliphagus sp. GCM10025308]
MSRTFLSLLLAVAMALALLAGGAAAQENNSTPVDDDLPGDPNGPDAGAPGLEDDRDDDQNENRSETYTEIDQYAWVESWSYDDGRFTVTVDADEAVDVIVMEPLDSEDQDSGTLNARVIALDGENSRTVTIEADGDVMVVTENVFTTQEYATLDKGSDALIGGPWTHKDSQYSAIGAGLAVMSGVIWKVLKRKTGLDLDPKRLA